MCDIVGQAVRAGVSRRNVLRAALGGAAVLGVAACSGNTSPAANQPSTAGTPAPAGPPPAEGARTQLVLLGTSGGSPYWPGSDREGIASALLVGDRYYVVDAGAGVLRQMRSAQLGNWQHDTDGPLDAMRAIFLTHLHSDHVVDLNNLLSEGLYNGLAKVDRKVQIWGPGNMRVTSDAYHVIERYTRTGDTIAYEAKIEDPKVLTGPFVYRATMQRPPDTRVAEYVCLENNIDVPHLGDR